MEFELWWLVAFPLFFALGWVAARIDIKQLVSESRALPRSYFTGLNFLLNEQPDKAIDAFLEAVKVDPQTIELHFALGNLFRRRGETDRAIRMHQNLVDRADLGPEQRIQAMAELGHDFLKAGLLDRAETIFVKLRDSSLHEIAQKFLLEIYQQEKEWVKAIEVARELPDTAGHLWQKEIANFFCELAAVEMAHSRNDSARRYLEQAIATNRKCVRASILQGDLEASEGNMEGALSIWKRVEQQNPVYLALVAARIMDGYRKLGRVEQGIQLLRAYLTQHPSLDLLDAVFQWEMEKEGPRAAYQLVRDELGRNPTLLGLDKLLEAALLTVSPEQRKDIELVKGLVHSHTRQVALYRCDECGFKSRQFYWRCPACGGWETYPPKRTEEYDLTP